MSRERNVAKPDEEDLVTYWRNLAEKRATDLEYAHQMINNMEMSLESERLLYAEVVTELDAARSLLEITEIKITTEPEEAVPAVIEHNLTYFEVQILEGAAKSKLIKERGRWKVAGENVDGGYREQMERDGLIEKDTLFAYKITPEGKKLLKRHRAARA